jgi:hypothetical protein
MEETEAMTAEFLAPFQRSLDSELLLFTSFLDFRHV